MFVDIWNVNLIIIKHCLTLNQIETFFKTEEKTFNINNILLGKKNKNYLKNII